MIDDVMANARSQLLVAHDSTSGPVVLQVRGSLVVSSLQTLRELNLYPRYIAKLAPEWHDRVLFALASSWVSSDIAMAHYGACDAMALEPAEMSAIGSHVAERIMGSFLATLLRGARVTGATSLPVVALQNYNRLWDRLLQGGGCKVLLTGPKDALIDSYGVPMFRYAYFRTAYSALVRSCGLLFCKSCYTRVVSASDTSMSIMFSWV